MIVFKNYFKIVLANIGMIIMFASISIGIAVGNAGQKQETGGVFNDTEPTVAIIDNDQTGYSKSLANYLKSHTKNVEIENNDRAIQDALYYGEVSAVVIIPDSFTKNLQSAEKPVVQIKRGQEDGSILIEQLVNKYIQAADIVTKTNIKEEKSIKEIEKICSKEATVTITEKSADDIYTKMAAFFICENYAFLAIMIFIIGYIGCIFNEEKLSKRMAISSIRSSSITTQVLLGNIVLGLSIWLVFVVIGCAIYGIENIASMRGLAMCGSSLLFMLAVTAMANMISKVVKEKNALSGIQNIMALGLSFISGCFVPTSLLAENVIIIAKLFPSYWYIKVIENIALDTKIDMDTFKPLVFVVAFTALYIILSLILSRRRKSRKN